MFTYVVAGVLLNNGGAAIYDAASGDLVLLEPDGQSASVLARRGEGPAEVGGPPKAMLPLGQDSLLIQDYTNTRFSLFAGGSFVRTTTVTPELSQAFGARGVTEDGNVLMSSTRSVRPSPEGWEAGYMIRLDLGNGAIDTIASYDWVPPQPAIIPARGTPPHTAVEWCPSAGSSSTRAPTRRNSPGAGRMVRSGKSLGGSPSGSIPRTNTGTSG